MIHANGVLSIWVPRAACQPAHSEGGTGGQAAIGTRRVRGLPPSAFRLPPSSPPSGFTLLEVLLTLGLSFLLLVVVALAIDLHLRLLNTGRAEVEQAQLARAILRHIAQDLHNAVQYNAPPSSTSSGSGGSSSSGGGSASSGGSGSGSSGGGGASGSGLGGTGSTSSTSGTQSTGGASQLGGGSSSDDSASSSGQSGSRTSNLADATSLPPVPGLYGNANELQVDVSRLPRLDQMQAILSPDTSTTSTLTQSAMSDVKTVLYFLANSAGGGSTLSASGSGLYRREMDRAVASYSSSQGQLLEDPSNQEALAPEVVDLEFQYYDGNEWVSEWDSTENNGLPLAVEISLTITKPQHAAGLGWLSGGGSSSTDANNNNNDTRTYTLLVNIPVAQATTVNSSGTSDSMSPLSGGP